MQRFELKKEPFHLELLLTQRSRAGRETVALLERTLGPCARHLEEIAGEKSWECSATVCGKNKIRALNLRHRQKDRPTDVLAFPVHEDLRRGIPPEPVIHLGDIFICRKIALAQADSFNVSYERELARLFFHGWLHLLGYDHEASAEEETLMSAREEALIESLGDII